MSDVGIAIVVAVMLPCLALLLFILYDFWRLRLAVQHLDATDALFRELRDHPERFSTRIEIETHLGRIESRQREFEQKFLGGGR